jgi:site-specific DNA-methyltransferase (adenine-specific)
VGVPYEHKSNIGRWGHTGGADLRCRGNNWFIPYETITNRSKDRPHPATFPVALPERCIRLHGNCGELTVMDPFLGIGSSWVAAERCGVRRFVGFELDEAFVEVARGRIGGEGQQQGSLSL